MRSVRWRWVTPLAGVVLGAGGAVALAQPVEDAGPGLTSQDGGRPSLIEPAVDRDGVGYPVSGFTFEYPLPHPDLPDPEVLQDIRVPLVRTAQGWIGPISGVQPEVVRIGDIGASGVETVYGSALAQINVGVRDYLEARFGLIGHLVTPAIDEIAYETTREDLRAAGQTTLTIQVWRAAVGEVRSIGFGQKWDRYARKQGEEQAGEETSLNTAAHERLREHSPEKEGDLLRRPPIDRYVDFLNRHPGRRVDVSLAPSGEPGDVVLDYLVTEAKDWAAYYQLTNTGTKSTDEWVHRFGYLNNQLAGRDDIIQFDYITAGFDESHAVLGSYEFPIHPSGRLRAKVYGSYNEYSASDVGFSFDTFEGEGYTLGAEVAWNVSQKGPRFIDLVGGVHWDHVSVNNNLFLLEGDEDFVLPYVAARLEKQTVLNTLLAELKLEFGTGGDKDEVYKLGRFNVEDEWATLKGSASYSFFLEPIFNPEGFEGRKDPDQMTLAHEVFLAVRGQWAFHDRLVPNYQQVAGGFFTVRGYDESEAVGDDAVIATAEYRFHLGKALPATTELGSLAGRPFRSRRTQPYGSADWDWIFRAFVDAARVSNNDRNVFSESNDTLVGVGVGTELRVKNNLTLRLDYGVALSGVGEGATRRADAGDSRLHFMATVLF